MWSKLVVPAAAEVERQPVLAVAQVPGEPGRLAVADERAGRAGRRRRGRPRRSRRAAGPSPGRARAPAGPSASRFGSLRDPLGAAASRGPGRPTRSGRPSRSRSAAAADRQIVASVGQIRRRTSGRPVGRLGPCCSARPDAARPGRSRRGRAGRRCRCRSTSRPPRPGHVGRGPSSGSAWKWPSRSFRTTTGRSPSSVASTRSMSRSSSMSSAATPVCGALPPRRRLASGQGVKAIERPSVCRQVWAWRRPGGPSAVGWGRPPISAAWPSFR